MRRLNLFFVVLSLTLFFASCNYISNKEELKILASFQDEKLLETEALAYLPSGTVGDDSIAFMKNFTDEWVKRKILQKVVFENPNFDMVSIEKKVQDLKYQLALHQYKSEYINKNLDSSISNDALLDYYGKEQSNFKLRNTIVRASFCQLPKDAPNLSSFKSKMVTHTEEFKEYCQQFAMKYQLNETQWVNFSNLVHKTPFSSLITNESMFLKKNKKTLLVTDHDFVYLLKIHDYKLENQIAPFDYVKEEVYEIQLNTRKNELIREMEASLYSNAKSNEEFEIKY